MQWQHGTYSLQENGSLVLTPISSDGRQLMSDPCAGHHSTYTHYNQSVLFEVDTTPAFRYVTANC